MFKGLFLDLPTNCLVSYSTIQFAVPKRPVSDKLLNTLDQAFNGYHGALEILPAQIQSLYILVEVNFTQENKEHFIFIILRKKGSYLLYRLGISIQN